MIDGHQVARQELSILWLEALTSLDQLIFLNWCTVGWRLVIRIATGAVEVEYGSHLTEATRHTENMY